MTVQILFVRMVKHSLSPQLLKQIVELHPKQWKQVERSTALPHPSVPSKQKGSDTEGQFHAKFTGGQQRKPLVLPLGFRANYSGGKSASIAPQYTAPQMNRAYKTELSGAL